MDNQLQDYTGPILPCPFDGYGAPTLIKTGTYVNGTSLYSVQCPVCNVQIVNQSSQQNAVNVWNLRAPPTFVLWTQSLNAFLATVPAVDDLVAWLQANPPVPD